VEQICNQEECVRWQHSVNTNAAVGGRETGFVGMAMQQHQQDIVMLDSVHKDMGRWRLLGYGNASDSYRSGLHGKRGRISVIPRTKGDKTKNAGATTILALDGHVGSTKPGYRRARLNGLQHGSARRIQGTTP
jgi:hypothetical protein